MNITKEVLIRMYFLYRKVENGQLSHGYEMMIRKWQRSHKIEMKSLRARLPHTRLSRITGINFEHTIPSFNSPFINVIM